ncbi:MAG: hypothetical protein AAFX51_20090, partial [Cyanobacteria bacterium J06636_28]
QRIEAYIQKDVEGFIARQEEKQEESREATDEAASNTEQALLRLNNELEERAQRLEMEKVRLAENQASQPQTVDDGQMLYKHLSEP